MAKSEPVLVPSAAGTVEHPVVVEFRPTVRRPGVVRIGETPYLVERTAPDTLTFEKPAEDGKAAVVYTVRRWGKGRYSCNCPDARYRKGACKHCNAGALLMKD